MILVTGPTGNNGSAIVRELLARGATVRGMVRDLDKARREVPQGVDLVKGDLDKPETLSAALSGVEKVMLLSSADARLTNRETRLVEAAKAAGVERIAKFSVIGAGDAEPVGFGRWHGPVEAAIRASGLSWTFLRPNVFMDNLLWFAAPIKEDGTFRLPLADAAVAVVDTRDIAAMAARVLTEDGHDGKAYTITGPRALTYGEMAGTLSRATGRSVEYVAISLEEHRARLVAAGMPEAYADAEVSLDGALARGFGSAPSDAVPTVLGRPARDFESFAADHRAAFN